MFKNKYILIGLTIIFIFGVKLIFTVNNKDEYKEFNYLPSINHQQFKEKFNKGEDFFVYIGRPDCGDSRKFEQEFRELFIEFDNEGNFVDVLYNLDEINFFYFDISEIIDSTKNVEKRMEYKDKYQFYFTPSLIHYQDKDGDGVSEAVSIAEWNATDGFKIADYMKWFYDTELVQPNDNVYHENGTIKQ